MLSFRRVLCSLALGCLAVFLPACGGGGGGGDGGDGGGAVNPGAAPAAGDYAPMAVGDRWVYVDEAGAVRREWVTGTRQVSGQTALVLRTSDPSQGVDSETAFLKTASTLTELPDPSDPASAQIGPVAGFTQPLQAGQRWVQVDKTVTQGIDLDNDGTADAATVRVEATVLGFETVSVAAGTFAQSAHVRTVATVSARGSATGAALSVTSILDEWHVPDVGRVRSTTSTSFQGARSTTGSELQAYRVGARTSDTRAPVLRQSTPAAGLTQRELYRLEFTFDKPMDLDSLRNGGLTITGPDGQALAMTLSQDFGGTGVLAYVDGGLPEGSSRVAIGTTATDLLGNQIMAQAFTVRVDRSAPAVLSSQPVAGAVDVPLDTTVRLQFDEPLHPAGVSTDTVQLLDTATSTPVPVTIARPDDRTVLLTPQAPLQAGRVYVVQLAPTLTDASGNAVANSTTALRFSTVQGGLSAPLRLAGATGSGIIAGDLDGDGRTDLLTVRFDVTDTAAFNVFRQGAGGVFEAPRSIQLPVREGCYGTGVARMADMDGDGRTDLLVARGTCGIEIAYQDAAGGFSRSALLAGDGTLYLRLVDVDGDGRRDVVATGWFGESVSVWLQRADGSWSNALAVPLFHNGWGDMAVGDLNGDGRPDIATTSGQGELQFALGVAYQQADGSFAAPQYRALAGGFGTTPLSIADLDGDGRADLLVLPPGGTGVWVYRQQADGQLAAATVIPALSGSEALRVADLDGNGRADILLVQPASVQLLLQGQDGSFSAPTTFRGSLSGDASTVWPAVLADFDGDGRLDLALSGPTLLLNRGSTAAPSAAGTAATAAATSRPLTRRAGHLGWRQALRPAPGVPADGAAAAR